MNESHRKGSNFTDGPPFTRLCIIHCPLLIFFISLSNLKERMMNIKWMDRITNEEVLERIREKRTLWMSLRKRRGQMLGHTLRHGGLLRDILGGGRVGEGEEPD